MSQFLLAQGVEASSLPPWVKVVPAVSDGFLRAAGGQIFGDEATAEVVTVVADNEDFDTVFLRAQRDMLEGKRYESTRLNELLAVISRSAKRVALWYGRDYLDLDPVHDFEGLTRLVREGLSSPSVEAYAMYVKQKP
jgi:hypothetical protein